MSVSKREERFQSTEKRDQRTPFQRDRDRVLHASSLRRLASVTQVVNPNEGRFYHNRLTHTLKVAQIGGRIAEALLVKYKDTPILDRLGGLEPQVVEAASLAHDLGHPPFGHIGEDQLNTSVSKINPLDGYEGNAQSFRIVSKLEIWRNGVLGLDLTRATVNALLKYPWFRPKAKHLQVIRNRKWGAYRSEAKEFNWARELNIHYEGHVEYEGMSLEASIMDWADDIAYATHDVEDFYRAGLIPLDRLFIDSLDVPGLEKEKFLEKVAEWRSEISLDEIQNNFLSLIRDLPIQAYRGTRHQQGVLRGFVASLISEYVRNTDINDAAANDPSEPRLKIPPHIHLEVKILKDLTRFYVIDNRALVTQQHGEAKVIEDLFQYYYDASAINSEASILPIDFQELLEMELKLTDLDEAALRARVVADVISSMTDDEALKMHQRLSGISPGSFLDRLP